MAIASNIRPSSQRITKTCLFKYTENFTSNNWKVSDKKLWYFSYFCSKFRLWVLVRTASPRRGGSNEYPQSMFLSRNKKNNVYPCKPQFYYIKVGFKGGQNFIGMFSWWEAQLSLSTAIVFGNNMMVVCRGGRLLISVPVDMSKTAGWMETV